MSCETDANQGLSRYVRQWDGTPEQNLVTSFLHAMYATEVVKSNNIPNGVSNYKSLDGIPATITEFTKKHTGTELSFKNPEDVLDAFKDEPTEFWDKMSTIAQDELFIAAMNGFDTKSIREVERVSSVKLYSGILNTINLAENSKKITWPVIRTIFAPFMNISKVIASVPLLGKGDLKLEQLELGVEDKKVSISNN